MIALLFFSLLKDTEVDMRLRLIKEFQSLISSKELFEKCLKFIPKSRYKLFLSSFPFDSLVSSLSELQSIADLFSSDQCRKIIFAQFTPKKLNCTAEEFALLTQDKFELKELEEFSQSFDPRAVIKHLDEYVMSSRQPHLWRFFSNSYSSEKRVGIAKDLIQKLQAEDLSPLEKITVLKEAKTKLECEYELNQGSGSRLHAIIRDALDSKKNSSSSISQLLDSYRKFNGGVSGTVQNDCMPSFNLFRLN